MLSATYKQLLIALTVIKSTKALPEFANKIPNGFSVPNPGPQGGIWAGVGHLNAGGGGERNSFGEDFKSQGYEWTRLLCETDSDGDGRSNGIELGDGNCEWVADGPDPPQGPALSHPGIVDEPEDKTTASSCDAYNPRDDEDIVDIIFSAPNVFDESQTHYRCEQRQLMAPDAEVFHQIKTSVLVDNSKALHHMFVYMCPAGTVSSDGDRVGQGTYTCGVEFACARIAGWAIGPHDYCLPENVGLEFDFSSAVNFVLKIEVHYDNTSGQPQQDQSGMRLHWTRTLRPLRSGTVFTGTPNENRDFELPPNQSSFSLVNICPSEVTAKMDKAIYAYSFFPHMHLYGRSLFTEHFRCGKKIGEIGRIDAYEFDNQQSYGMRQPIKVLPGDALVTTCTYDTLSADATIVGGESTTDEMCLNFISFYPFVGTDADPALFSGCFSFENGIVTKNFESEFRFAIADQTGDTVVTNFESDPLQSFAACCQTDSCEELYMEEIGGACGVDSDCVDDLVCLRGLCGTSPPPAESSIVLPQSPSLSPTLFMPTSSVATVLTPLRSGGDLVLGMVSILTGFLVFGFIFEV